MRHGASILTLIVVFVLVISAEAAPLRTASVRELVLFAETSVLAEPLEPSAAPTCFKVLEVLRGSSVKRGDTLTLDLGLHNLQVHDENLVPLDQSKQPIVEQALLFLGPDRGAGAQPRFEPISSGLRFWTREHTLLEPVQIRNPGGYVMKVRRGSDWSRLVRQARTDSAVISDLFERKKMQPSARRNRALLEWVEQHRHEFAAPSGKRPDKATQDWGHLETQVFQWVLDSCEPKDCWSAVKLYAQLNGGAVPPLHEPAFGTREGRALLLRIATANDSPEGDRVRALTLLSHPFTLWAGPLQRLPKVQFMRKQEQIELLDRIVPLLKSPSAAVRAATALAVRCVSHPEVITDDPTESNSALPALRKAYRAEPPGEARDELAEAIFVIGGAKAWQELTGEPPYLLVRLRDLERRDRQILFVLSLRPCGQVVYERPTLMLERLNTGNKVLEETKQMPLPVLNLPKPWSEGWDGSSSLLVSFFLDDFKPGLWRIRVQGTAGKEKRKWTTQPKTFVLEAPRKQKAGVSSSSTDR